MLVKKYYGNKNLKIKLLSKEQIIISADRLTRFKDPESKYLRVFREIILNNLIEPKFKKSELDNMDYENIKNFAQEIINSSLPSKTQNLLINQRLYDYENSIFKISANAQKLLKNKINYPEIIKLVQDNAPINLKFLKALANSDVLVSREKSGFCFPVEKIILCEGITEEILLPKFAKICGFDFGKNGIYVISAGGKNQVVKYFYNFADCLKIPIFVLLDNDASENLAQIRPRLRKNDKIHLLKSGEFEDLLPNNLIIKTLNFETKNISIAPIEGLEKYNSKVEFLEEFFKHRGLHEFKKAEFAQAVKENISDINDISHEIREIITEIKLLNSTEKVLFNSSL